MFEFGINNIKYKGRQKSFGKRAGSYLALHNAKFSNFSKIVFLNCHYIFYKNLLNTRWFGSYF